MEGKAAIPVIRLLSRFRSIFTWSITTILTLSMVLPIAVLMGVTTLLEVRQEHATFREHVREHAILLAVTLDDLLSEPLYSRDVDKLRDLTNVVRGQPDIGYIEIFDPAGQLLVDAGGQVYPAGSVADELGLSAIQDMQTVLRFQGDTLEVAAPIVVDSRAIGGVRFGYSTAPLQAGVDQIINDHIWQSLALMGGGIVFSHLLALYFVRPIRSLVRATRNIADGDLKQRIATRGSREITELATAFNDMAGRLEQTLARKGSVTASVLDCVISIDSQGKVIEFNPAAQRTFGYSEFEASGRELAELAFPPSFREAFRDNLTRYTATGEGPLMDRWSEVTGHRADNTEFPMEISVTRIPLPGSPTFTVVARDITQRKQAEEELRIFKLGIERSGEAIFLTDINGTILYVNPEFEDVYGFSREEAIGKTPRILKSGVLSPEVYSKFWNTLLAGEVMRGEIINKTKDGRLLTAYGSANPILDGDGKIIGFLAIQRDITQSKQADAQLEQAISELKRSNAELENFAYIASHDLQEPLRMVSSYVQLLARRYQDKLDGDANDFIAYAVDGANRMQRMVNDLLLYSRVGTRGKDFELVDCEVAFDQTVANLGVAIEESGAIVTHDPLPTVMADASQLIQVFQNLVGNAIKFRREKPPHIHISVEQKDNEWVFSVRDDGIGIAPEYYDRVFQIFQRLHNRQEYPGTGIGLAICKRVVQRHGGRIWLESQVGRGSAFYFTMPASRR